MEQIPPRKFGSILEGEKFGYLIDESLKESFPASDPPAHSGVVPGGPRREKRTGQKDDQDQAKR
jgi:hypothetical protein